MNKKKVGIIFGGKSAEHEVSLQSAKNIVEAIDQTKYDVVLIGIDKTGKWNLYDRKTYLRNENDPKLIQLNQPKAPIAIVPGASEFQLINKENGQPLEPLDAVFPIVHGTLGEDGSMQGLMRICNLPFAGSGVLGSAVCMDKEIAKILLQTAGIHVAKGMAFQRSKQDQINYDEIVQDLGLPMFIKPANQGSSVGVAKVSTKEEFEKSVQAAFQYDHKIIIEEGIVGQEIECAVLGNEYPKASIPGEILPQTEFYSYESKYIDEKGADLAIPANLTDGMVQDVQATAIKAYQALQCEGLARVDFFVTSAGKIYVNEINTLPGFTRISMYPKLWEISGISYPELIDQLIQLAIKRSGSDRMLKSAVWETDK